MDPKFNGGWSASEINMVKSLIARDSSNNNSSGDMNKKHNEIMDELQAMFPSKEKHKVITLYADLMGEMTQTLQSGNQHVEACSNLMSGPFGVFVRDSSMGNMKSFDGYRQEKMFVTNNMMVTPQRKSTPRKESQHIGRFWTIDEHRLVIY